jgi:hypothetical protein
MSDLSNDTKKHTSKSRETIPLSLICSEMAIVVTQNTALDVGCE